jgi:RNA polymerase-binding transcription factor DksA
MHYRYFTLEQRDHLEHAIRDQVAAPTELAAALERLHSPDYGTCEACGVEMQYSQMIDAPRRRSAPPAARRCPRSSR